MSLELHVERVASISDRFETVAVIGDGTYGEVEKCRDLSTGEIVAIKRIRILNPNEGFPLTTFREIRLLKELRHVHVIFLRLVLQTENDKDSGLYLVFDYCEFDLYALLYMPDVPKLQPVAIKSLMKQFLVGLHHCGIHNVVHRDLKPANMLVTRQCILKLGDFGLARKLATRGQQSDKVITLWYRPPELLLGCQRYGPEVDIWSAGCILYEMATCQPLFQAREDRDIAQLAKIFGICGLPTVQEWPEFRQYQESEIWKYKAGSLKTMTHESQLRVILGANLADDFVGLGDLLVKMLEMNPQKRISAENALNHPFFRRMGRETDPDRLPRLIREEMHQKATSEKRRLDREKAGRQLPERVRPPDPLRE
jgi:serine/threonine protein kinase